ncbi:MULTISPECIES: hypothetical protein [Wolbachia]|uniref:hypothetical protein n=1 Tax=Wolbachia TaxID=953 RepID=UPI0015FD62F1|nr:MULTISPECIES: hypothetical protein [Wolbachia]MBA8757516.1 hypothetical protein [Wolbachia pipientis]MDE5058762.1 hypothetical protein [Wolbachia endosymbiont of Drosophila baimaii]
MARKSPFTYAEACENSEAVRELGNILNKRATQQSTVVTAKTTTARSEKVLQDTIGNIETPANACENSNKSSLEESIEHEYLKPCENSNESNTTAIKDITTSIEKLDNAGICEKNETAAKEAAIQEQKVFSNADSAEAKKPLEDVLNEKTTIGQQVVTGKSVPAEEEVHEVCNKPVIVGVVLLASGVALYIMKMPVVAAVVGIVGLACIGLALYSIINPNTKLEKVEEQSITAHPPLKAI